MGSLFNKTAQTPQIDLSPVLDGNASIERRVAFLESETMRARRTALLAVELQGFDAAVASRPGKRILVAGWYGADNLGDELMLRAVLNHLPEEALDRTAVLLWDNSTYDRLSLDPRIHAIHYPASTRELDALVDHFDVVVWGGGAILDDAQFNDDANNFNTGNLFIRINELMIGRGKQVYCLGLSANEQVSGKRYIEHLKHIARHAAHFSLRDSRSIETLARCGISKQLLHACEDLVFSFDMQDRSDHAKTDGYTIGFILFHGDTPLETYARMIAGVVDAAKTVVEGKTTEVLLIPFLNEGHFDDRMNAELKGLLANLNADVDLADYTLDVSSSPIRRCDAVVCYKYHAALIACSYGIPCLIASRGENAHYANKMTHLAHLAGIEDCLHSAENFNANSAAIFADFLELQSLPAIDANVHQNATKYLTEICDKIAN